MIDNTNAPIPLNWDFSFSDNRNNYNPELSFSRNELQTLVQNNTEFCIDSVATNYKLSDKVVNSIYNKISQFETSLVAGCEGEYINNTSEALSIGNITKKLGNVALMPNTSFAQLFPKDRSIFLSVNSAIEEARFLDSSLKVVVPVYKDNDKMISETTMDKLKLLSENPRKLMETAISMAYARRLLKYGLLRNEDMPVGMIGTLGFDKWLVHCKEKQGRATNYNKNDKSILRGFYEKENLAVKNLRYSLWTSLFYSIINVDPEQDPFLYAKYAQQVDNKSEYSVTFNYEGTTCRLDNDDIKGTLNKIFVPSDTKMAVIVNKPVE